jgi:hypothetical protein
VLQEAIKKLWEKIGGMGMFLHLKAGKLRDLPGSRAGLRNG